MYILRTHKHTRTHAHTHAYTGMNALIHCSSHTFISTTIYPHTPTLTTHNDSEPNQDITNRITVIHIF